MYDFLHFIFVGDMCERRFGGLPQEQFGNQKANGAFLCFISVSIGLVYTLFLLEVREGVPLMWVVVWESPQRKFCKPDANSAFPCFISAST